MSRRTPRGIVVTAFAEHCAGPGWANDPVWVVVRSDDGRYFMECLQPEDQPEGMVSIRGIAEMVHVRMRDLAEEALAKVGRL